MQPLFSKSNVFSCLAVFLAVMAFDAWLQTVDARGDGPARLAEVRLVNRKFDSSGFAPLVLAGAWEVEVDDPRFGGVSALAIDRGALLALTDSGTVIRFPRPGQAGRAFVRDLPAGPGSAERKIDRDSEALARDPAGRGWWVAFEFWHQLWLYDPAFRRPLSRIDLGERGWRDNAGVEAMDFAAGGLLLLPEPGGQWLRLRGRRIEAGRLTNPYGDVADAVRLPDGRLLLVTRRFGLSGIAKHLVEVTEEDGGLSLRHLAALPLGARDNVEAIAAEPRPGGGTRLWLMTDNDFRPRKATLLVALDLP